MAGSWWIILIYVALFGVLYLVLIRPSSKRKKEEQAMRNNVEVGDEITTIGGIQGRIIAIKDDEDALVIESGPDRTKMKFKKWAISSVDTVKEDPTQKSKEEKLKELQEMREKKRAEKQAKKEEKEARKNNE